MRARIRIIISEGWMKSSSIFRSFYDAKKKKQRKLQKLTAKQTRV